MLINRDKPERITWDRFSFAKLIEANILVQKSTFKLCNDSFVSYLELIEGELVSNRKTVRGVAYVSHGYGSNLSDEGRGNIISPFQEAFGEGFCVWLKHPLPLGCYSVLLPRLVVTLGENAPQLSYRQDKTVDVETEDKIIRTWGDDIPTSSNVVLVMEHSTDTLEFGRAKKAELYALAGIPEYWVYRVKDEVLEVYRDPLGTREKTKNQVTGVSNSTVKKSMSVLLLCRTQEFQ